MSLPTVQTISDCFIKPRDISDDAKQPLHFAPWDIAMLSVQYIQKGLLYVKPRDQDFSITTFLEDLKTSLSATLTHFYPLAGRLATYKSEDPPSYVVYIDPNSGPGAKFIHSRVDLTISDILSPTDVPLVVQSFFDHDKAINHDGHSRPLLSIQVTELVDGIFIGCSMNHAVGDGTSYWHFFNAWSEVFNSNAEEVHSISRPPVHKRWMPEGYGPTINLPFTDQSQIITRSPPRPILRERIFHFSSKALSKLKSRANAECNTSIISSLQALSALMWRCITRARNLPLDRETGCRLAINNRPRLSPPLSPDYFGNSIQAIKTTTTVKELLDHSIGWSALKLNKSVLNYNDKTIREHFEAWMRSPFIYQMDLFDPDSIMMGSSPRFDMYGNEFGLGKGLALRSGYAHKFDGKVTLYPGYEGGGSMDLEITLLPEFMRIFESDDEFLSAMSSEMY